MTKTIPIEVPSDLLIALNSTEIELQNQFQVEIAILLFNQQKLTIGKAIQLSKLTRREFEKELANRQVPVSQLNIEQILSDVEKLKNL